MLSHNPSSRRVVRDWGGCKGWTVLHCLGGADVDVLDTWPTLRAAKDDIDHMKSLA